MTKNHQKQEIPDVAAPVIDRPAEGSEEDGYEMPENHQAGAGIRCLNVSVTVSPTEKEFLIVLAGLRGSTSVAGLLRSLYEDEAKRRGLWPIPPSEELTRRLTERLMTRSDLRAKGRELMAAKRQARAEEQ